LDWWLGPKDARAKSTKLMELPGSTMEIVVADIWIGKLIFCGKRRFRRNVRARGIAAVGFSMILC
jgi:hypothetical protein